MFNEMLHIIVAKDPGVLLELFNIRLHAMQFPRSWKMARLALVYNGKGKSVIIRRSFRPMGVNNNVAMLIERLILGRLYSEITTATWRFGFRAGRSTVNDIKTVKAVARGAASRPPGDKHLCLLITLNQWSASNLNWSPVN